MKALLSVLFLCYLIQLNGQYTSPFNNEVVKTDSTGDYSFIISGHFYGGSSNTTGYPANTLLAHIDEFNASDAIMLVCLGDLFMDVRNDIPKYESSLFSKLKVPLLNSVGNHDLSGDVYQQNFGETVFGFELGDDYHIVVDTEVSDGDLNEKQTDVLRQALAKAYENVFVYSHRTIWKKMYPEMDGIFEDNTQSMTGNNFESEIYPILSEVGLTSKVYWFSGSLGDAPASFFYHKDNNITYVATAIRALPRDAVLEVSVQNGDVEFKTKSLTGQELEPLEYYNVDFWQSTSSKPPFNWRLLPLYAKQTVFSWSFLWGILFSASFIGGVLFFKRRRKRRAA
jgi:hypothetical protein